MRMFALALALFAAAQVVAQDESAQTPAAPAAAAPEKAESKPAEPSLDDPPEAGAAVAKAQEKTPEQLAKEKAKKEFEETVARFKKTSDDFNSEIMATIKRKRDARMRRIDIDFEQRIGDLERREAEKRKSAIKAFERFVSRYAYDAEYSPQAMFRLAELYFEQAKYDYNDADEEFSRQLELFEAKKIGKEPEAPMLELAKSIKLYETILKRFPKFEQNDGVQYLLAFCLEETGEFERSLSNYEGLVTNYPESKFVPEVWLRIGENHFTEDRLCEALDAYQRVLSNRDSAWFDKALYKVAWTHYRLDRFDAAYKRFVELVDFSDKKAEETGESGSDLRKEAIQYIAVAAVEQGWGRPATGEALDQCKSVVALDELYDEKQAELMDEYDEKGITPPEVAAGDRLEQMFAAVGGREYQREVYLEVAKVLFDQAAWQKYVPVAQRVIELDPLHADNPNVAMNIIAAYDQLGREKLAEGAAAREALFTTYGPGTEWQEANKNRPSVIRKAMKLAQDALISSALFRLELAQKYFQEEKVALASEEARVAAQMLSDYIQRFPYDPNLYEYNYYLGIGYTMSVQFLKAADVFELVRDDKKNSKFREDAAYRAFLNLQAEVDSQTQKGTLPEPPPLAETPQEIPRLLVRLIDASMRYIKSSPDTEDTPRFYFNAATIYAQYSHKTKADKWYRKLIDTFPLSEGAVDAARWVLNQYSEKEDWKNVEAWCRRMLKIGVGKDNEEFKTQMSKSAAGAVYKQAVAAFGKKEFQLAHDEFLRLVKEDPKNPFAAKALYSAAQSMAELKRFMSAGLLYERVFREYPEDKELAAKALFNVASTAYEGFEFDRAISLYLKLVSDYKDFPDRADALYNAGVALQSTEQFKRAALTFQKYTKLFRDRPDVPEVFFNSALVWEQAKNSRRMKRTFDEFIRKYGGKKEQGGRVVQIYSKLSDQLWDDLITLKAKPPKRRNQLRRWQKSVKSARKKVDKYVDKTLAEYRKRGFAPQSLEAAYAAKAHFRQLEAEFEEYAALDFGVQARKDIELAKKLQKRIKEKFEWANKLEKKYLDIFQYQHFDWTLAASYRIGSIWENFADKLYNAPVPRQFRNDDMMMDEWKVLLEQQAEPFEQRAVKKYGELVTSARKRKFRNNWTKQALQSLNRYAREEWPIEKEAITSSLEALLPGDLLAQPFEYRRPPAPPPEPEQPAAEEGEAKSEDKGEEKPEDKGEAKSEDKGEEKPEDKGEAKSEDKGEEKPEDKGEAKSEDKPEAKPESAETQPAVDVTPSDVPTPDQVEADQKSAEEKSEKPAPDADEEEDK